MRRLLVIALIPVTIFVLTMVAWLRMVKPPSKQAQNERVVIKRGLSATEIATKLADSGVIKSPLAFKFYVGVTSSAKKIQAGEYILATDQSLYQVVNALLQGPREVWVTIPEGWRREQIAERLIDTFGLTNETADAFYSEFLKLTQTKEGYLFPDTYLLPKDATPSAVVSLMGTTFTKKAGSDVTRSEAIVASIVERETRTDEERPIVAGILWKRFQAGWPLQADATLQFLVGSEGNWWPVLTKEDLEIDSYYNTYKYTTLPPGPIANPGLSSIKAATNPEDSAYWFYLHDEKGQIHYAETLEEHNANIARYLGK